MAHSINVLLGRVKARLARVDVPQETRDAWMARIREANERLAREANGDGPVGACGVPGCNVPHYVRPIKGPGAPPEIISRHRKVKVTTYVTTTVIRHNVTTTVRRKVRLAPRVKVA